MPGQRAGGAGRPHRPAHAGGQAPAAVRVGDRQGRAVPGAGGDRRSARRGAARRARAAPGGRAALRGELLPRDRVHVQARADPRGGLRQPAPRDAARPARAHRGRHRAALRRAPGRARGAPGPSRPARRAARAGGGLSAPGRGQGGRALGAPGGGGLLRAGARGPRGRRPARAPRWRRPSISSSTCAPPWRRWASSPARSITCGARPRRPRHSATGGGSAGCRRISPSRTTRWASRPPPSGRPSARWRPAGELGRRAPDRRRPFGLGQAHHVLGDYRAAQRHLGRAVAAVDGRAEPRAVGHGGPRLGGVAHLACRLAGRHRRLRRRRSPARARRWRWRRPPSIPGAWPART